MSVQVLDFGGVITTINVPDKKGKFADVTLGFDNMQGNFFFAFRIFILIFFAIIFFIDLTCYILY